MRNSCVFSSGGVKFLEMNQRTNLDLRRSMTLKSGERKSNETDLFKSIVIDSEKALNLINIETRENNKPLL